MKRKIIMLIVIFLIIAIIAGIAIYQKNNNKTNSNSTVIKMNEVTNIFTDSDLLPKINAKYYRNFVTTIQNLQVNEKALKQELADINTRLTALETAQTNVVESEEEANDIQVQ